MKVMTIRLLKEFSGPLVVGERVPEILSGFPACLPVCENSCHVQGCQGFLFEGGEKEPNECLQQELACA